MSSLQQVFRILAKQKSFSILVLVTLSLALGASTTMFAMLDGIILQPLPFTEPDQLVSVWNARPEESEFKMRVRAVDFLRWQERASMFQHLALVSFDSRVLTGRGDAAQVFGSRVSEEFFSLLEVRTDRGRTLVPRDFAPNAASVVVLSNAFWRRHTASDPEIVGQELRLDGEAVTVVGVLADQMMPLVAWQSGRFEIGARQAHYWLANDVSSLHPTSGVHGVIARLATGKSLEQGTREMALLTERLEVEHPETNQGYRATIVPLHREAVGRVSTGLWLLFGAVVVTLLIANANIANLFLIRSRRRRHEVALRSALGAPRRRIWLLLASEALVLVTLGGCIGVAAAYYSLEFVQSRNVLELPRLDQLSLSPRVLLASLGFCACSALLSGFVPSFQASRGCLQGTLRSADRGTARGHHLRSALVVAEMALAVSLVIGAGLLIKSFDRLASVDPGFDGTQTVTFKIAPRPEGYPELPNLVGFYDRVLERLDSLPGVQSAAAAYDHPLDSNWTQSFRTVAGTRAGEWQVAAFRTVTSGYFETIGAEILEGRDFDRRDRSSSAGVVVVNQSFARRYFPESRALGQEIELTTTQWRWGDDAIPSRFRVVGLVEDIRFSGLGEASEPGFYLPYRQTPHYEMTVLVRSHLDEPEPALVPVIRETMRSIDPNVPVARIESVEGILARETAQPRLSALGLSGFSLAALVLAVVGLWGVLSSIIAERRKEIGIRVALGATRGRIFGQVVGHGMRLALAGLAIGMVGSLAFSQYLQSLLFEVSPFDLGTFVAVPVILSVVAFAACSIPTLQAAKSDPIRSLRETGE